MKPRNDFLKQLKRAQAAKGGNRGEDPVQGKPTEEMSAEELEAMRRYHAEHGVPPFGFFARLWWRLGGRGDV